MILLVDKNITDEEIKKVVEESDGQLIYISDMTKKKAILIQTKPGSFAKAENKLKTDKRFIVERNRRFKLHDSFETPIAIAGKPVKKPTTTTSVVNDPYFPSQPYLKAINAVSVFPQFMNPIKTYSTWPAKTTTSTMTYYNYPPYWGTLGATWHQI